MTIPSKNVEFTIRPQSVEYFVTDLHNRLLRYQQMCRNY